MSTRSVRSSLRWRRTYSGRTAPASILLRRSSWQVMSLWRSGRISGGSAAILRLRGGFCGRPWLLVRRDEPIRVKRYAFPASSTDASRGAVLFELPASGHRDASASNALAGLYAHPPHRVTKSRISWRLAENRGLDHCHQDRRGGSSARSLGRRLRGRRLLWNPAARYDASSQAT
jgi:hypothetical protein